MTDEEKNIFGKQLKERRNELNLTTQKVALDMVMWRFTIEISRKLKENKNF